MPATIEHIDFHGQPALRLATASGARAVVALQGAQVLSWTPPGGEERLYLSPQAVFDGRTAVRGGPQQPQRRLRGRRHGRSAQGLSPQAPLRRQC